MRHPTHHNDSSESAQSAAPFVMVPFPSSRPPDWPSLRHALRVVRVANPVELHVVRHGETEENARGLVTGTRDATLTEQGRRQAEELGAQLTADYGLALTSSMRRAKETLKLALAASAAQARVVQVDSRLNERSLGELEGRTARQVPEYAEGDLDWAPTDGETYREVARRVLWFLLDLAIWSSRAKHRRVLVSTHSGPLRMLTGTLEQASDRRAILGRSFENGSLTILTMDRLELPPFLRAP